MEGLVLCLGSVGGAAWCVHGQEEHYETESSLVGAGGLWGGRVRSGCA